MGGMRHHCTSAGLRLTSAADLSDWPSASIAFVSASRDPVASSGRRRKAVWRSVFTRRFGNARAPRPPVAENAARRVVG